MGVARYGANLFFDRIFGSGDPATIYLALTSLKPLFSSVGGDLVEPDGGGYERLAVANDVTQWPAASNGVQLNGEELFFATATDNWGTVAYVAATDAAVDGNLIAFAKVPSRVIIAGRTPRFPAGSLTFTLR